MTNAIRMIFAGCMLLISTCFPIKMIGQKLAISGDGQLRVIPSLYDEGLVIYDNMLPYYKPMTKNVIIKRYDLRADQGELKRDYTHVGPQGFWKTVVSYDRQGNVVEVNDKEISLHYVNNKIVEITKDRQPGYKYSYDSKGHLESAVSAKDTYKYNVDTRGDITSVKEYFGVNMSSTTKSMSYDNQHRMTAYHEVGDFFGTPYSCDYRWVYNKKGILASYKRIFHKNGRKTEDLEYQFEFDAIGNPTRCIRYRHGDITIIDGGYEYSYEYTFYPDPKEQERKEALEKREQIKRDSIQLVTQRKNDSINLEEQRKESLRQERNKELLQVCKFLFDSNVEYELCVVKQNDLVEHEIKSRVVKKLQYIYPSVLEGKELRNEKQPGRNELIQICNMCNQLSNLKARCGSEEVEIINQICDYTESKLGDFVSGRSALNKAYKKTSNKSYSSFLLSYMNDK